MAGYDDGDGDGARDNPGPSGQCTTLSRQGKHVWSDMGMNMPINGQLRLARGQHLKVTFAYPERGVWYVCMDMRGGRQGCCAEGFAVAAAIKHATRIINGPPAAKSGTPTTDPAAVAPPSLSLPLCGCLCPAVIDFESFFNWQHTGQSRAMDSRTAGGRGRGVTGAWTGGAGLFVFAFDKLFACKVNEGPGQ